MPNPAKKATVPPSGASSGTPLRIPRKTARKAPNVVKSTTVETQPKAPTIAFLCRRLKGLYEIADELTEEVNARDRKHLELVREVRDLRGSFTVKVDRVVRALENKYLRKPPQ